MADLPSGNILKAMNDMGYGNSHSEFVRMAEDIKAIVLQAWDHPDDDSDSQLAEKNKIRAAELRALGEGYSPAMEPYLAEAFRQLRDNRAETLDNMELYGAALRAVGKLGRNGSSDNKLFQSKFTEQHIENLSAVVDFIEEADLHLEDMSQYYESYQRSLLAPSPVSDPVDPVQVLDSVKAFQSFVNEQNGEETLPVTGEFDEATASVLAGVIQSVWIEAAVNEEIYKGRNTTFAVAEGENFSREQRGEILKMRAQIAANMPPETLLFNQNFVEFLLEVPPEIVGQMPNILSDLEREGVMTQYQEWLEREFSQLEDAGLYIAGASSELRNTEDTENTEISADEDQPNQIPLDIAQRTVEKFIKGAAPSIKKMTASMMPGDGEAEGGFQISTPFNADDGVFDKGSQAGLQQIMQLLRHPKMMNIPAADGEEIAFYTPEIGARLCQAMEDPNHRSGQMIRQRLDEQGLHYLMLIGSLDRMHEAGLIAQSGKVARVDLMGMGFLTSLLGESPELGTMLKDLLGQFKGMFMGLVKSVLGMFTSVTPETELALDKAFDKLLPDEIADLADKGASKPSGQAPARVNVADGSVGSREKGKLSAEQRKAASGSAEVAGNTSKPNPALDGADLEG